MPDDAGRERNPCRCAARPLAEQETRDHGRERDERSEVAARHTRHQFLDVGESAFADAAHLLQVVDRLEPSHLLALADDRLRQRRADAGQRLQIGCGRGVEVERTRRRAAVRSRVTGDGNRIGFAEARHGDALAVVHRRREVEAVDVGIVGRTARGRERVAHTRAAVELDDAGRTHRADDVHERAAARSSWSAPGWPAPEHRHARERPRDSVPDRIQTTNAASSHHHDHGRSDSRIATPLLQTIDERQRVRARPGARELRDPACTPPRAR